MVSVVNIPVCQYFGGDGTIPESRAVDTTTGKKPVMPSLLSRTLNAGSAWQTFVRFIIAPLRSRAGVQILNISPNS
jgi:flagellar motor switch protein FliM